MSNQLPLIIEMGALPLNFQGTPQQLADAIAARLRIVAQQAYALFARGSTEPSSNVGPWMDTTSSIGIWKAWDDIQGNYQPMPVADATLRYILSNTEPDPQVFQLWVKLNNAGQAQGVYTYYNGAWHDIYESTFATFNVAVNNVFKPYGAAGTVLTSNGPDATPTWNVGIPIGGWIGYGGATAPLNWLTCNGAELAIASQPALFAAIGSVYGGNGITTFAVPDFRGRSPYGFGTGDAPGATPVGLGQKIGAQEVVLTQPNLPSFGVTLRYQPAIANGNAPNPGGGLVANPGAGSGAFQSDPLGNDVPVSILGPGLGSHFIIRAA